MDSFRALPRVIAPQVTLLREYGIASKILAKMDDTEKEFLNDLFEAKLNYVITRPYWNEPQAKPKMY